MNNSRPSNSDDQEQLRHNSMWSLNGTFLVTPVYLHRGAPNFPLVRRPNSLIPLPTPFQASPPPPPTHTHNPKATMTATTSSDVPLAFWRSLRPEVWRSRGSQLRSRLPGYCPEMPTEYVRSCPQPPSDVCCWLLLQRSAADARAPTRVWKNDDTDHRF